MKKSLCFFVTTICILGFITSLHAEILPKPAFTWPSAYMIAGEQECEGKIIHVEHTIDGKNMRTEMKTDTTTTITVFNSDTNEYFFNIAGHTYKISSDQAAKIPKNVPPLFPTDGTWESIGKEKIDNKSAIKYKITQQGDSFNVWISEDGQTPMRVEFPKSTMKFVSYKSGHPDPKLFQAPADQPKK